MLHYYSINNNKNKEILNKTAKNKISKIDENLKNWYFFIVVLLSSAPFLSPVNNLVSLTLDSVYYFTAHELKPGPAALVAFVCSGFQRRVILTP